MASQAIDVVKGLYKALEEGWDSAAMIELFAASAVLVEYPNLVTPQGATRSASQAAQGSKAGAELLAWQRYELRDAVQHGDLVIARVTWTAEVRRDRGVFRAGQRLTAHLARFVTVHDGRITRLETYDCYEPFAGAAAAA